MLKLSYDGLDDEQKDMFLDIACFHNGCEMNNVKQTLDGCGFSAAIGMPVLIDRCLISTSNHKIVMHDLIQDMGQEVVRQQCVNDPGKRSRLWKHKDIYRVLKKNKVYIYSAPTFLSLYLKFHLQSHTVTWIDFLIEAKHLPVILL